jgi:hypothetical protein
LPPSRPSRHHQGAGPREDAIHASWRGRTNAERTRAERTSATGTSRESTSPDRTERLGALIGWALIFEGLLLLFVSEKHRVIGDGMTRFISLRLLFERGELSDMPYSMIGPIFASPLYLLDRVVDTPGWWASRYNFFVFVAGLVLLWRLLRPHLDDDLLRRFLLLLVVGSMFPRHQMEFYGEVFTAILAGAGLLSLCWRNSVWGWLALLLAVANTPATIIGLAVASVALTLRHRRSRFLVLPLAAGALVFLESWVRRGDPMLSGYEGSAGHATILPYSGQPGFTYPFLFGLISILFSFGKGLLFFAPGLFLHVKEGMILRSADLWQGYRLWLLFLAGMVVVYAKWWSWYGGWFWGPRFFLFASLPASLALAVALGMRRERIVPNLVLLLVLGLSITVGATGVVFDQYGLEACTRNNYALEALCWYVPEYSALFHPFVDAKPLTSEDLLFISFAGISLLWLALPVLRDLGRGFRAGAHEIGSWSWGDLRF